MKQQTLLLIITTMLCLSSCTTTYNVISKSSLDKAVSRVSAEMETYGYYPAGSSTDTRNEVTVTGQSYSKYSGYGTKMDNNYITSDTYRFSDTAGNTMNYTISYQLRGDNNFYYLTDVDVKGCETSNVKDYNKLCGANSPQQLLENLPKDKTVDLYDETKTYTLIGAISLLSTLLVVIVYL